MNRTTLFLILVVVGVTLAPVASFAWIAQFVSTTAHRKNHGVFPSTISNRLHPSRGIIAKTSTTTTTTNTGSSTLLNGVRGGGRSTTSGGTIQSMLLSTWSAIKVLATRIHVAIMICVQALQELTLLQKGLFVGIFVLGFLCGKVRPVWKPFRSVNDIPNSYFGSDAPPLKGRAISVSDGDTIRFLHTPISSRLQYNPNKKYKVTETCLPVRVCTYDSPETPKFGNKGQPFGIEAKKELTELLQNKAVYIRLLQKDQYSRVVAEMWVRKNGILSWLFPKMRTFVDEHMLGLGFGEVYQGGGAVYGPLGLDAYLKLQDQAKSKKVGIWSLKNRESAAEYKKRTKT